MATPVVALFRIVNGVVITRGLNELVTQPDALAGWTDALAARVGGLGGIIGPSLIAFPLLVLGPVGIRNGGQHVAARGRRWADPR
ncbi:hypothetical protein E3T54_09920 [Cryobacterium sp. Sr8]|uniref:hypothetical protein n=1 Tax=Cryobacterium sp. Sr8 TaxID=1259203 RepID=UPI00106A707A|nr:hypothetical protein [Cryobacterium sp. Sr8]TFD76856.1 hypothetical protein E3T54_09920 [Cryobacterium sp. Sr8]